MEPTIVLVVLNLAASIYAWNNHTIYQKWMLNPYQVSKKNEYYRFLTSGFIHGDLMHLVFNIIALYSFGQYFEAWLSVYVGNAYQIYYYTIYIIALIISDLPTYFKHKNDSAYNSLGASGAVSAIVFACIILNPLAELQLYFFIPIPAFIFGFMYLTYSYFAGKQMRGGINHDAHFYGAVFGVAAILFIYPHALPEFFEQIKTWRLF